MCIGIFFIYLYLRLSYHSVYERVQTNVTALLLARPSSFLWRVLFSLVFLSCLQILSLYTVLFTSVWELRHCATSCMPPLLFPMTCFPLYLFFPCSQVRPFHSVRLRVGMCKLRQSYFLHAFPFSYDISLVFIFCHALTSRSVPFIAFCLRVGMSKLRRCAISCSLSSSLCPVVLVYFWSYFAIFTFYTFLFPYYVTVLFFSCLSSFLWPVVFVCFWAYFDIFSNTFLLTSFS